MKLKIGDYISFYDNEDVLYKVIQISIKHILIKNDNDQTYWERKEYIQRIVKIK